MSHMPGLIRPARDVSPLLGSPQTELESATVPGLVQCPGDPPACPLIFRGDNFSPCTVTQASFWASVLLWPL